MTARVLFSKGFRFPFSTSQNRIRTLQMHHTHCCLLMRIERWGGGDGEGSDGGSFWRGHILPAVPIHLTLLAADPLPFLTVSSPLRATDPSHVARARVPSANGSSRYTKFVIGNLDPAPGDFDLGQSKLFQFSQEYSPVEPTTIDIEIRINPMRGYKMTSWQLLLTWEHANSLSSAVEDGASWKPSNIYSKVLAQLETPVTEVLIRWHN